MLKRTRGLAAVALVLVVAACGAGTPTAPPLNSERIEQVFGSYAVDVLYSDARLRVSSLYSSEDGVATTRTLAIVAWADTLDARLAAAHAAIQGGASLGATLQAAGWTVQKRNLLFLELPAGEPVSAKMRIAVGSALAAHGYALEVERGDLRLPYATIAELHHPAYLDRDTLEEIYGGVEPADAAAENGVRELIAEGLARIGSEPSEGLE